MAYDPSPFSSNTIWLDGFSFVFCCCLGGTCTSNALRDIGWVIMKMISSTSSTSISGVTLISELSPSRPLVDPIAIGSAPFLLLLRERLLLLGDGADDALAGLADELDRLLYAAELDVLVGLEEQDLVLRARLVDRL